MLKNNMSQPSTLEITVISAQGLKASSSILFPNRRLRPFITITTAAPPLSYKQQPPPPPPPPPPPAATTRNKSLSMVYQTKVDNKGGFNPTWGDKFLLPLEASFVRHQSHSCVYLHLYTKNFFRGHTQLGWCRIPVSDILDGFLPAGSLRHLAYRLRATDGSRGHGIVNVAVKLEGAVPMLHPAHPQWSSTCSITHWPEMNLNASETVMGIPVTAFPPSI